ncbi:MAG: ActS/PrrB/RegB family redox-sensitive histidine kinase [Rhizobiales bacterium]|nr:ActS/PrrB/RegB family redox-sensitive histidine kinase [Hyphomicrobiales bacterium]
MSMDRAPADGVKRSTLRVDTLARLRWLAVVGQSASVAFAALVLGFEIPIVACLVWIALLAALNIGLRLRYRPSYRLPVRLASLLLGYDIVQLAGLLYLTGGLANPFAMLFLAPVTISATSLPRRNTAMLWLVLAAASGALALLHGPLPWLWGARLDLPQLYAKAVWASLMISAAFIGVYASRVAEETQQLSDALAATDLALARYQHLAQLDGLAAAAAHELGTPLGTVRLVAREWLRALPAAPTEDDIRLVAQEIDRCRTILGKLRSMKDDALLDHLSVAQLVEEAATPHRGGGVDIRADIAGEGPEPTLKRNPGLTYGIGNLVENAADFAATTVRVTARWTRQTLTVSVADDGPGFAPQILAQIGDPYLRSAKDGRRVKGVEGGLGLGLFIAKTLLERSGARFSARNAPEGGAVVTLRWERAAVEADEEAAKGAFSLAPAGHGSISN